MRFEGASVKGEWVGGWVGGTGWVWVWVWRYRVGCLKWVYESSKCLPPFYLILQGYGGREIGHDDLVSAA